MVRFFFQSSGCGWVDVEKKATSAFNYDLVDVVVVVVFKKYARPIDYFPEK